MRPPKRCLKLKAVLAMAKKNGELEEFLLGSLRDVVGAIGRKPSLVEVRELASDGLLPSLATYGSVFGPWPAALKKMELGSVRKKVSRRNGVTRNLSVPTMKPERKDLGVPQPPPPATNGSRETAQNTGTSELITTPLVPPALNGEAVPSAARNGSGATHAMEVRLTAPVEAISVAGGNGSDRSGVMPEKPLPPVALVAGTEPSPVEIHLESAPPPIELRKEPEVARLYESAAPIDPPPVKNPLVLTNMSPAESIVAKQIMLLPSPAECSKGYLAREKIKNGCQPSDVEKIVARFVEYAGVEVSERGWFMELREAIMKANGMSVQEPTRRQLSTADSIESYGMLVPAIRPQNGGVVNGAGNPAKQQTNSWDEIRRREEASDPLLQKCKPVIVGVWIAIGDGHSKPENASPDNIASRLSGQFGVKCEVSDVRRMVGRIAQDHVVAVGSLGWVSALQKAVGRDVLRKLDTQKEAARQQANRIVELSWAEGTAQ